MINYDKMRKVFLLLFTVFFLGLTSCLTIYEKYTINRDGSGTFEYIIDLSELYSMMETFASEEDMNQVKNSDFGESFRQVIPELKDVQGISKIEETGNPANYVYGIKFDFGDVIALNKAMALLLDDNSESEIEYVNIEKKKFVRYHKTSNEFSKEALLGEEGVTDESMMKGVLEGMKYKIIVNLPRKVKSVQTRALNEKGEDGFVEIEANFNSMLEDNEYLKTVIKTR